MAPNVRTISQADLAEALEDELFGLREQLGDAAFPKTALQYLDDWAAADKGWLRKFYRSDSDEPQFDLTPAAEKAILWLGTLAERGFVGTESRLLTLFELLRQISEGTETDPVARVVELQRRRAEIEREIIGAGRHPQRKADEVRHLRRHTGGACLGRGRAAMDMRRGGVSQRLRHECLGAGPWLGG